MTKRYLFSFDDRAQRTLDHLYEKGDFLSKGEAVRESIHIAQSLQAQAIQGYTEFVVRNPQNQRERVVVIPTLIGPNGASGKSAATAQSSKARWKKAERRKPIK